jgi:hypothetical protein
MDSNVQIIIKIAKFITEEDHRSVYLYSGLLFEAEDQTNKLNGMGIVAAISWLCHESSYIEKLGCCYRVKEALESKMIVELSKLQSGSQ